MLEALIGTITGPLGGILAGLVTLLGAFLWGKRSKNLGRKEGAEQERTRNAQETVERVERGRQAVRDGRGDSPADRLRRNDGRW